LLVLVLEQLELLVLVLEQLELLVLVLVLLVLQVLVQDYNFVLLYILHHLKYFQALDLHTLFQDLLLLLKN
jgi:hypothetical protein